MKTRMRILMNLVEFVDNDPYINDTASDDDDN